MRCYYQLINYVPSADPKPENFGRAYRCSFQDIPFPTTLEEFQNSPQMKNKGNILQYKKNQNPLSKSQIYSRKVRGEWTNNKKTYASQTEKLASPNTGSLLRVGGTLISVGGDPTSTNTYCIYNPDTFPSNQPSEVVDIPEYAYDTPPIDIVVPPPPIGDITADTFDPPPVDPEEPENYVAPSGGVLLCNTTVIPTCDITIDGQVVVNKTTNIQCYPSDTSDVPGMQLLCWDEGEQTWYDHTTDVTT